MKKEENFNLIEEVKTEFQIMRFYEDNDNKELIFTLDTYCQFREGKDEKIYHSSLLSSAIELCPKAKDFLVLGGGDGLISRNILDYNSNANITLVDIDKKLIEYFMTNDRVLKLNKNSLKKCTIINEDAVEWVKNDITKFDIIILDLPDPNLENLKKLYTYEFYNNIIKLLKNDGAISIQAHISMKDIISNNIKDILGNSNIKEFIMPWMGEGYIVSGKKYNL